MNADTGVVPAAAAEPSGPRAASAHPATVQAKYLVLGALNPLLRPHLKVLGDHFGGEGDEPLAVQRVDLVGGRTALLVSRLDEQDPLVLVVDHDRMAWSRPLPVPPAAAPFAQMALAPRGDGGVALFGYVADAHVVSARMWASDGGALPEMRVASFEACGALSSLYAEGSGWLVACSSPSGTRAQLLRESGDATWGEGGAPVGEPGPVGPATLVRSTSTSWVLVQRAQKGDLERVLAFRYGLHAEPLWAGPADIGVSRRASSGERLEASLVDGATVRVELPQGLKGARVRAADVAADGTVRLVAQ